MAARTDSPNQRPRELGEGNELLRIRQENIKWGLEMPIKA